MWFRSFVDSLKTRGSRTAARRTAPRRKFSHLRFEALEDRRMFSFTPAVSYQAGASPVAVLAADFNNDTARDLAVLNNGDNSVSLLLGNGDGTFDPALTSATGYSPGSLAAGDFDGDGNLDLATANGGDVSVLLGDGAGRFQAPSNMVVGGFNHSVAVGDFNGDGLFDLGVTSKYEDGWGWFWSYAHVLPGNGDGTFAAPNATFLGDEVYFGPGSTVGPSRSLAANLNGDGFDDFVTTSFSDAVSVLLGDSSSYLQGPSGFSAGSYPLSVAAGDVDGDGDTDVVTGHYDQKVTVLLGDGAGSFVAAGSYATPEFPYAVELADFTGDGKVDVATANIYSNNLSVLVGGGDGNFAAAVNFAVGYWPVGLAAGDFNGDGWLDAATANNQSGDVSVLINDHSWLSPLPPSVTVNDVTVTEGNDGSANATFRLTLSFAHAQAITVHYETVDGSATAGSDFTAASGDVTFAPGEISKTVTVAVLGDRLAEPTENFFVNLSAASNATIADGQGVGTLIDDEPRISISDVFRYEGQKGQTTLFTFTVSLSAPYDEAVTLSFRAANGTAKANQGDYVGGTGTLTFAPGETSKTITIEVKGDSKREANETFYLDLFGNSSNSLFTKHRGLGTILNDD
jgi:hypothetical protein